MKYILLIGALLFLSSCEKEEDNEPVPLALDHDYTSTMRKYAQAPTVGEWMILPLENNEKP